MQVKGRQPLRSQFHLKRRCPRAPSFYFRLSVNVGHIAQLLASVYSRFTTIQLCPSTSTSLKQNVSHFSSCARYITTTKFSPLMAPLFQTKLKMRREFHSISTHVTTVHRNHHPAFGCIFTTSTGDISVNISCCPVPAFRIIRSKNDKKYIWLIRAF